MDDLRIQINSSIVVVSSHSIECQAAIRDTYSDKFSVITSKKFLNLIFNMPKLCQFDLGKNSAFITYLQLEQG